MIDVGHAAKEQISHMVRLLLPGVEIAGPDAADALAVAICHAHHRNARTLGRDGGGMIGKLRGIGDADVFHPQCGLGQGLAGICLALARRPEFATGRQRSIANSS